MTKPIEKAGTPSLKFELYEDRIRVAHRFRTHSGTGTDIYLHNISGIEFESGGLLKGKGHIRFLLSGGVVDRFEFDRPFADGILKFKKAVERRIGEVRTGVSPQAVSPGTPGSGGTRHHLQELERLTELWERRALTDDEFAQAKRAVLTGD
jgi:hypothetical protein